MILNYNELKDFYEKLDGEFEGYIQHSSKDLEIFRENLPKWEEIYQDTNFIHESAISNGKRSILIRKINNEYLLIDEDLEKIPTELKSEEIFYAKNNKKVSLVQVFEEKEDENCLGIDVIVPKYTVFKEFYKESK